MVGTGLRKVIRHHTKYFQLYLVNYEGLLTKSNVRKFQLFVSHSHRDKQLAGKIKQELESRFGISVFVAHEDINPTEEWQETIRKKLWECDAFVAILTNNFKNSNWTDQETGIAIALEKTIIPIKIDINPYGFISKYQALKWKSDNPIDGIRRLVGILHENGLISTDELIESFAKSISFEDAGLKSELLGEVGKFSKRQINQIAKAAVQSDQIFNSFRAQPHLRTLFSKYRDAVEPKLTNKLKRHLGPY